MRKLDAEMAILEAEEILGLIPEDTAARVKKSASFSVDAIREIDAVIDQEMIAFLRVVRESLPACLTYANIPPLVEEEVCRILGIRQAKISTQIVARDRHYLWVSILCSIANSLEKFSTNIRNLQRTEIGEVEEAFKAGGGSSAMPHKRNPNVAERICSLTRLLRAFTIAVAENQAPCWGERS